MAVRWLYRVSFALRARSLRIESVSGGSRVTGLRMLRGLARSLRIESVSGGFLAPKVQSVQLTRSQLEN